MDHHASHSFDRVCASSVTDLTAAPTMVSGRLKSQSSQARIIAPVSAPPTTAANGRGTSSRKIMIIEKIEKTCRRCGQNKPVSAFSRNTSAPDGFKYECKSCQAAYNRANAKRWVRKKAPRRKPTPQQSRAEKLRQKYGITLAEFAAMLAAQNGKCAICQTSQPGGRFNQFHVDHCHDTGVVRGLLCAACNTALGTMGDKAEGVLRHIRFLETAVLPYLNGLRPAGCVVAPHSLGRASLLIGFITERKADHGHTTLPAPG